MAKLAIIHTTPATVEPLRALAQETIAGCEIVNFVDDSILPQLAANQGNLRDVEERLTAYARFARSVGADIVLEACSSVGELASAMQEAAGVPVVRIDEAMAEQAVQRGTRIGVAATLATTLQPTTRLLESKARTTGRPIQVHPRLIEGAYAKLMEGDRESHDRLVVEGLRELARANDVVVLSQASMARVLPSLPPDERDKFLISPPLAMERVQAVLTKGAAPQGTMQQGIT
jgi:aspartate/glutamate racemase